jgi:hypothetical protein
MPDTQVTPQQTQAPQAQPNPTSSVPDDIVSRASAVSPEQKVEESEIPGFDRKKHEEILSKLPSEVKASIDAYQKELFSGANKKFQEAAELKKQAEATRRRPSVSELLQDPDFVKEAQSYAQQQQLNQVPQGSPVTEEEWSALTPTEKQQIHYSLQQNQVLQGQMNKLLSQQEDQRIKERYKNYESSKIDQLQQDLIGGRIQATREHLWKVLDYEDGIKRAYELGLQDRQLNMQEKVNGSSPVNGLNIKSVEELPTRQTGQSNIEYFKQLAQRRIQQYREGSLKR